jgi:hypothetical protein
VGALIDSDAADCHLSQQEGEPPMPKDAKQERSEVAEICTVCHRDPNNPPSGWKPNPQKPPRGWNGSDRAWVLEKWAARCRVVAKGLCAKDYAAQRRPKSTRSESKGADKRETVWVRPETKAGIERVRRALKRSKSALLREWVEAGVQAAETSISESPGGAEA